MRETYFVLWAVEKWNHLKYVLWILLFLSNLFEEKTCSFLASFDLEDGPLATPNPPPHPQPFCLTYGESSGKKPNSSEGFRTLQFRDFGLAYNNGDRISAQSSALHFARITCAGSGVFTVSDSCSTELWFRSRENLKTRTQRKQTHHSSSTH